MSNSLYNSGRNNFLGPVSGQVNWTAATIYAALVAGSYVFNASHVYVSDVLANGGTIPSNARGQILGKLTDGTGVAGGNNVTLTSVPASITINQIIIYVYNASDSLAELIGFIDTGGNLPFISDGSPITIQWSSGPDLIFKL